MGTLFCAMKTLSDMLGGFFAGTREAEFAHLKEHCTAARQDKRELQDLNDRRTLIKMALGPLLFLISYLLPPERNLRLLRCLLLFQISDH